MILVTIYPFWLRKILKGKKLSNDKDKLLYGKIFCIYKNEESAMFECVILLRKFLFGLSLVWFHDYPVF